MLNIVACGNWQRFMSTNVNEQNILNIIETDLQSIQQSKIQHYAIYNLSIKNKMIAKGY